MGSDKARLSVHSGLKQLDHALGLLAPHCARLGVSVGRASKGDRLGESTVEIFDSDLAQGPLAGVIGALGSDHGASGVLALACDLPFACSEHVLQLLSRRDECRMGTCFVAGDGAPEPLFSIYEASCLEYLRKRAADERWSLRRAVLQGDFAQIAAADTGFLVSINSREDLRAARARLGG